MASVLLLLHSLIRHVVTTNCRKLEIMGWDDCHLHKARAQFRENCSAGSEVDMWTRG